MTERSIGRDTRRSVSWWRRLLTEPAVPFLLIALMVLIMRGYLPDILLVAAGIAVIVLDSFRWRFRESQAEPAAWGSRSLPAAAVLVAALILSVFPRVSTGTDLTFTAIGGAALWVAWMPGLPGAETEATVPQTPPRWWLWWLPALLFCLVEILSLAYQPAPRVNNPDHPALSSVLEPALGHWPERAVTLVLWFAAGVWLLRRIRAWAS